MSTPNIQAILQANLSATNNLRTPPPYIVNFDFANPTFAATTLFYEPYFLASTTGSAVQLPATTCYLLAVLNLSSSISLGVTITPTLQPVTTFVLGPGDPLIIMNPSKAVGTGFTTLLLSAGTSPNCPCMLCIGA
jgi:hypothetical protein